MKQVTVILAALLSVVASALSVQAETDFATKLAGSYTTGERDFVTVKRLTFTKERDGSIKVEGALVGFPEEVSLGEAVPETFETRKSNAGPDMLLAKFSSVKFKPFMVIQPSGEVGVPGGSRYNAITYTCYMTDVDGKKVHIGGNLFRKKEEK